MPLTATCGLASGGYICGDIAHSVAVSPPKLITHSVTSHYLAGLGDDDYSGGLKIDHQLVTRIVQAEIRANDRRWTTERRGEIREWTGSSVGEERREAGGKGHGRRRRTSCWSSTSGSTEKGGGILSPS